MDCRGLFLSATHSSSIWPDDNDNCSMVTRMSWNQERQFASYSNKKARMKSRRSKHKRRLSTVVILFVFLFFLALLLVNLPMFLYYCRNDRSRKKFWCKCFFYPNVAVTAKLGSMFIIIKEAVLLKQELRKRWDPMAILSYTDVCLRLVNSATTVGFH